ncbi:MAG: hypothetical protein AAF615_08015 [Pseudomonadota bacterium]
MRAVHRAVRWSAVLGVGALLLGSAAAQTETPPLSLDGAEEGQTVLPGAPAVTPPADESGDGAEPGEAALTDIVAQYAFAPDAADIIVDEIVPAQRALSTDALRLQNAVLRHCAGGNAVSLAAIGQAFDETVGHATQILPLGFGTDAAVNLPAQLLTEVESTVFSLSQLNGMMAGDVSPPRTLSAIRDGEPAMAGLPALERLLLNPPYDGAETLANRCLAAIPVAAAVRASVVDAKSSWSNPEALDPHWRGDDLELADRLRLRDLIQGTIDAIDRFDRHVGAFAVAPAHNARLPLSDPQRARQYLAAVSDSLRQQVARLNQFAEPNSDAAALLAEIKRALEIGRERLTNAATGPQDTSYLVPFGQAHADIIERLPSAFGFDASAFGRTITSFELLGRPQSN